MDRYNPSKIEAKWKRKWLLAHTYEPDFLHDKNPFYNLMMFPYPSAEGLHIGSVRTFTGVDIYGRFKRMQGADVFEPIGLDGFGIHSENYALKTGKHPARLAKVTEKNFYRQLSEIGNGFAWTERLETYNPEYYKWTQWIFTELFRHGLAYRKKAAVNWCPSCKTVLADEQVISGKCERCGTVVEKRELEQWFFKITDYAERLLKNIDSIDWDERVKIAQKNWIGKSEGALLKFSISNSQFSIEVFTTRPDTLFGATYMVLSPEYGLIQNLKSKIQNWDEVETYIKKAKVKSDEERIAEGKAKTGVELKGIKAINPANKEEIPLFVADYVLGNVGTGAIMAVPAHDQRDFDFAKKYNLPIKIVICPHWPEKTCPLLDTAYTGEGHLVDSGAFDGTPSQEARKKISEFVGGVWKIQYRLRDWLISRQRYWGPPIPMIFCESCNWQPVPESDLPVKLPFVKNFRPTGSGKSPLASVKSFYEVKCPKCAGKARRETDVSDTFLDSAWYFLRYPSVNEKNHSWNPATTKKWLPVNIYIGGLEHSVLHLLYSRFLTMALHDFGLLDFEEPFTKFIGHGLITKDGAKMSKSKGNVVNPDEYIRAYGADAMRMYLAFLAPLTEGGDFRDSGIKGITRFLERVWKFVNVMKFEKTKDSREGDTSIERSVNEAVKKITIDTERLQYNTSISALMVLINVFEEKKDLITARQFETFLKLLAPFAPFMAEELWQKNRKGKFRSIHREPWPQYNESVLKKSSFDLIIQVNGKVRGKISLPVGVTEAEARKAALKIPSVKQFVSGEPKRIVFVPNKLINFVV